ncbi:MAG: hypothetical protein K2M82_03780, partial [Lachnospiraceae bacterium]|nr:hypothetical protein [Lachnospiraceae bacterium]
MKKHERACPYCGSSVTYIEALSEISVGEHTCGVCNKNSNIIHDKKIYVPAAVILVIAIAIAALLYILGDDTNLILSFCIILIPFAVFFLLTPFYYSLKSIRSEAITPVVKQKVKSKRQSQITPRAIKYEEKKRLEKEKISMEKKENSFKSKFSKFVKTYIIVDDDEVQDTMPDISPVDDKTKIVQAIKEENIEEIKAKLEERAVSEDDAYEEDDEDEEFNFVQPYDEQYYDDSEDFDEITAEPDYTYEQNEEEINISSHSKPQQEDDEDIKVYTSENLDSKAVDRKTEKETITILKRFSIEPEEDVKTENSNSEKIVYHRLNRITNVNFVYYPEDFDTLKLDFDIIDEEERDNEEILSFFSQTPNDDYENVAAFGVKQNAIAEESYFSDDKILKISYDVDKKESIVVKTYDKDKAVSLDDISFDEFADKIADKVQSEIEQLNHQDEISLEDDVVDSSVSVKVEAEIEQASDFTERPENEELSGTSEFSNDTNVFMDDIFELLNANEEENSRSGEQKENEANSHSQKLADDFYEDEYSFADDEADDFENKSYYSSFDYSEQSEFEENYDEAEEKEAFAEIDDIKENESVTEAEETQDNEIFAEIEEAGENEGFAEIEEAEENKIFAEIEEAEENENFVESEEAEESEVVE